MQPKVVQPFVPEDRVEEINPTTRRFSRTLEQAFPNEKYPRLTPRDHDEYLWHTAMAFCIGVLWGLLLGMWSRA
jgi:hypothetical protein